METPNLQWPLLVGVLFAIVAGFFVARRSAQREPIYGGTIAYGLHYVGAGAITAVVPTVLTSLVVRVGLVGTLLLVLGFWGVGFLALLLFAMVERPARAAKKPEEKVWTEHDARTSRL